MSVFSLGSTSVTPSPAASLAGYAHGFAQFGSDLAADGRGQIPAYHS